MDTVGLHPSMLVACSSVLKDMRGRAVGVLRAKAVVKGAKVSQQLYSKTTQLGQ